MSQMISIFYCKFSKFVLSSLKLETTFWLNVEKIEPFPRLEMQNNLQISP